MNMTGTVNERIVIELSANKMNAYVTFEEPLGEGRTLTKQEIIKEIEKFQIKKGIDKIVLAKVISPDRMYGKKYHLARGLEPKVGEPGKIEMNFDKDAETLKPKMRDDGTVDYKNLDNISIAKEGDIIATLIPPTIGDPGYNVPGEVLPGREGKAVQMPKGAGVTVTPDGLQLKANVSGRIIYADGKISVSNVYEVSSDVGPETGNINFNGSVIVRGNVMTDFAIKATGNVEVFGIVEGAEIYAGGNVLITKGILGVNKAKIRSTGNVTAKNIQNASEVIADGDIFSEAIMHSAVKARGKIEVGGSKGLLVGGNIESAEGITAKTIGSALGTSTIIHIGGDASYLIDFNEKKAQLKKLKETMKENVHFLNSTLKGKDGVGGANKDVRNSLLNTISNTKGLKAKIESLSETVAEMEKNIERADKNATISAEVVIYPNVTVNIGNVTKKIDREEYKCKVRNHEGEIRFSPL